MRDGGGEGDGRGGNEKEGRSREEGRGVGSEGKRGRKGKGGKGGDVEGPGKWSAPGPALALGGPVHPSIHPSVV